MERFERIILFANAHELDGLSRDVSNRKRSAASGIAVHLREYDAGESEFFVELVGGFHRVLSGHGVGDEQDFLWAEQFLERLHFFHQLFVDVQSSGGIDN